MHDIVFNFAVSCDWGSFPAIDSTSTVVGQSAFVGILCLNVNINSDFFVFLPCLLLFSIFL